VDNVEAPKDFN